MESLDVGKHLDRVHSDYTKHFYGIELADPSLYHVAFDSTAIPFDTCVELIASAARAMTATGPEARPG
jgi:cytidylate kinase